MDLASLGASGRWGGVQPCLAASLAVPKDAELCDCSWDLGMLRGMVAPGHWGGLESRGLLPGRAGLRTPIL